MGLPPQSAPPLAQFDKLEKLVPLDFWLFLWTFSACGDPSNSFQGRTTLTDQASLSMQIPRPLPQISDSLGRG